MTVKKCLRMPSVAAQAGRIHRVSSLPWALVLRLQRPQSTRQTCHEEIGLLVLDPLSSVKRSISNVVHSSEKNGSVSVSLVTLLPSCAPLCTKKNGGGSLQSFLQGQAGDIHTSLLAFGIDDRVLHCVVQALAVRHTYTRYQSCHFIGSKHKQFIFQIHNGSRLSTRGTTTHSVYSATPPN